LFPSDLLSEVEVLLARFRDRGWMLATAESCTGGLIAAALTEIAGSSDVLERGFVTYSNEAKEDLLGVDPDLIRARGAVSAEVARAMADGALARSRAQVAVSVTGIAGPGGGSDQKPVGLVHFGLAAEGLATRDHRHVFTGDRAAVRLAALRRGLALLREKVDR
jgi:nicotinamide-nucleotide amidase